MKEEFFKELLPAIAKIKELDPKVIRYETTNALKSSCTNYYHNKSIIASVEHRGERVVTSIDSITFWRAASGITVRKWLNSYNKTTEREAERKFEEALEKRAKKRGIS